MERGKWNRVNSLLVWKNIFKVFSLSIYIHPTPTEAQGTSQKGAESVEEPANGGKCCEKLASGLGRAVVHTISQLWLPTWDLYKIKPIKHATMEGERCPEAPPLTKELSVVDGCWSGESHFSLGCGYWYVSHAPRIDYVPVPIWTTLTGLSGLKQR